MAEPLNDLHCQVGNVTLLVGAFTGHDVPEYVLRSSAPDDQALDQAARGSRGLKFGFAGGILGKIELRALLRFVALIEEVVEPDYGYG